MFLKGLLLIANLVGGFVASSTYIVSKVPKLTDLSKKLNIFKMPIGLVVLLISVINIFNFWAPSYPKISLIAGLLTGMILSVDILNRIDVDEETKDKLFNLANKFQIPVGLVSLFVGLFWIMDLLTDVISVINDIISVIL